MSNHNEVPGISALSVLQGMRVVFQERPVWTALMVLESIIYRLFMLVGSVISFVFERTISVLKLLSLSALVVFCILLPGTAGLRFALWLDQQMNPRACKMRAPQSNRELYESAIHEAGHAVVALRSFSLRYRIEEVVVYRRAKKCSESGVWRTGYVKMDFPPLLAMVRMTRTEAIERLSVLYAGALANKRFTPTCKSVGDKSDREHAYSVSLIYGTLHAGGPFRGQAYGVYLRAAAKRRAQEILEREHATVVAVAKRLRATPNKAVSVWDLFVIDRRVARLRRK
jgi:transposase